jgi:poly-beta-1,6-N-acetyl-D-glucosamine synthase
MNIIYEIFKFFFEHVLLIYAISIMLSYVILAIVSISALALYHKKNKFVDYAAILKSPLAPTISILAPAFNESKTIVDNVHSLLSLNYPNFEVIIINDGSKDNSLELLIKEFELTKIDYFYNQVISTQKLNGIYKSKRNIYSKLVVVDKENGGKADALNAGINVSEKEYFISIDVDCILEQDALIKMIKPFIEAGEKKVIASGGVIRVANSCVIKNGNLSEVKLPTNNLAKFQILEYFRAFILGRMAWSRLNGLLLISGAFGMFNKEIAIKVGGYSTLTVGEDMELVVRMRRYMHENKLGKYIVAFIPDPLCWTEVPESRKILLGQRNRWTRGTIETLLMHKKIIFNPKYGKLGVLSYPYWLLFEWLAPIIEITGVLYFIILLISGNVSVLFFVLILLFIYTFSITFSISAVLFEEIYFHQYKRKKDAFILLIFALLEPFIHHPFVLYSALKGNYDFFFKGKHGWGKMTRVGFTKKEK